MFDPSELAISLLLVVIVIVIGAWFLRVQGRTKPASQPITPQLTILVALLTPAAVIAAGRFAGFANVALPLADNRSHWLWHFLFGVLALPVAIGLHRFRRDWPARGWTARSLAAADWLVRGVAVGNVLAAIGAVFLYNGFSWRLDHSVGLIVFTIGVIVHTIFDVLAVASLLILPLVCIFMIGVGVRGALRPAVQTTP